MNRSRNEQLFEQLFHWRSILESCGMKVQGEASYNITLFVQQFSDSMDQFTELPLLPPPSADLPEETYITFHEVRDGLGVYLCHGWLFHRLTFFAYGIDDDDPVIMLDPKVSWGCVFPIPFSSRAQRLANDIYEDSPIDGLVSMLEALEQHFWSWQPNPAVQSNARIAEAARRLMLMEFIEWYAQHIYNPQRPYTVYQLFNALHYFYPTGWPLVWPFLFGQAGVLPDFAHPERHAAALRNVALVSYRDLVGVVDVNDVPF